METIGKDTVDESLTCKDEFKISKIRVVLNDGQVQFVSIH